MVDSANSNKCSVPLAYLGTDYSTDVITDQMLTSMLFNIMPYNFGELEKKDFPLHYVSRYFGKLHLEDDCFNLNRVLPADKEAARTVFVILDCVHTFNKRNIAYELTEKDIDAVQNFMMRHSGEDPRYIGMVLRYVLDRQEAFTTEYKPIEGTKDTYSIAHYPGLGFDLKTTHCRTLYYFLKHYPYFRKYTIDRTESSLIPASNHNFTAYKPTDPSYLFSCIPQLRWLAIQKSLQYVANRLGPVAARMEACLQLRQNLLSWCVNKGLHPALGLKQNLTEVQTWQLSDENYNQPMGLEFYTWVSKMAQHLNPPLRAYTQPAPVWNGHK